MTGNGWLWLGTGGMAIGGAAIFLVGGNRTKAEGAHRALHVFPPMISCAYFYALAMGFGAVKLPDGREFLWARWPDWAMSTPLLLLGLAMTGLGEVGRWKSVVATLLGADIYMILTGFAAAVNPPPWKWGFYILSWGGFMVVYRMLWGPIRRESRLLPPEQESSYLTDVKILSIIWLGYPIVFTLGPDGTGAWSAVTATACITLLDFAAKVGFGLFTTLGRKKVTSHQLEGRSEALITRGGLTVKIEPTAPARVSG